MTSDTGTYYKIYGEKWKPTVVLIHGIGLTSEIWQQHIIHYTQDFQVLCYDLPGHGKSKSLAVKPTLSLLSFHLNTLLEELNIDTFFLIGFSLGGMLNRRFAMDYSKKVKALVILNSPHERGEELQQQVEERAKNSQSGANKTIDATLQRWFTKDYIRDNDAKVQAIKQTVLANNPQNFGYYRELLATGVIELIRPTLQIKKPTLIITCEHDVGSTPEMSYAIASEIPDSQVKIIGQLQHLGLIEQPQLFYQPIIDFLKRL